MEILIWQVTVASTVLIASRFHRHGHLYVAAAWTLFTIVAVYASSLMLFQLLVAWGAAALVQARRRSTQDQHPSGSILTPTASSISDPSTSNHEPFMLSSAERIPGDSNDAKSGVTGSEAPAAFRSRQTGKTSPSDHRQAKGAIAPPDTELSSHPAEGRHPPTADALKSTWHPTFEDAATHAKKLAPAVVKPDGAGYRVDANSADQSGPPRKPSIAKTSDLDLDRTYSSPRGRFEIRRSFEYEGRRWDLLYKEQWLGFYSSPFAAAAAVYRQSTGSPEWDSAPWTDVISETSGWELLAR